LGFGGAYDFDFAGALYEGAGASYVCFVGLGLYTGFLCSGTLGLTGTLYSGLGAGLGATGLLDFGGL